MHKEAKTSFEAFKQPRHQRPILCPKGHSEIGSNDFSYAQDMTPKI